MKWTIGKALILSANESSHWHFWPDCVQNKFVKSKGESMAEKLKRGSRKHILLERLLNDTADIIINDK